MPPLTEQHLIYVNVFQTLSGAVHPLWPEELQNSPDLFPGQVV